MIDRIYGGIAHILTHAMCSPDSNHHQLKPRMRIKIHLQIYIIMICVVEFVAKSSSRETICLISGEEGHWLVVVL